LIYNGNIRVDATNMSAGLTPVSCCDASALCFLLKDLAKYLEAVTQKKGDLADST
jgi:hypothetical protein